MTPEGNKFEGELISPVRAWALLGLFGGCFSFYFVLTWLLPHDLYIRYQQFDNSDIFHVRWVYERIHYDKTPIDVAIVGSSRVEAAISAPILQDNLSRRLGRPIHVANLAVPEEGRNLHYLIARELLKNHPETRIILVSVVEQADLSHPGFRYLSDPADLFRAPLLVNHYYLLDAAFLPYRQLNYFIQTRLSGWFSVSRKFRTDYLGTDFDSTNSFYLPNGKLVDRFRVMPKDKLVAGSRRMIADDGGTWHQPSQWHALNFPLEPEYSKRLVELAHQHCVEPIFVRLPFYNSPPHMYDEAFYQGLAPLLDAEMLSKDPNNYGDAGHFNRFGRDLVSNWLKNAIVPYLGPLENSQSCPGYISR